MVLKISELFMLIISVTMLITLGENGACLLWIMPRSYKLFF